MTYIRRQVRNGHIYLSRVRSYRDKETGKVKQEVTYIGKEVEKDGKKTLIPPVDRRTVRRVLDSAGYIMYLQALDNGFLANYEDALLGITNIRDAAKKILMLAAETIAGPDHSIHLHAGIPELKEKEIRDVVELVGMKDPDVASILERSMAADLVRKFGSSGIVYDLSAIRDYGSSNDLARYGHYYHVNGENREINFVLAVTRKHGIPIHYRTIAGNIPSVSTIHTFSGELKDYGILTTIVVIDRGFYSADNLEDLRDYSVIGALPSSLSVHDELIHRSGDIENSRNYIQYQGETIFSKEEKIRGTRYIVYFSPRLRSQRLESFYSQLAEKETFLNDMMRRGFHSKSDKIGTIESGLKGFRNLVDIRYSELTFTYSLKHNAIQRKTNAFGYIILFINTQFPASEILKIYREKDVVEKAFSHIKPHMEPFFSRTEEGTRAKLFLTILG